MSHFVFMRRCALLVAVCSLTACATPGSPVGQSVEQQSEALQQLSSFRVTGGLAVWTEEETISTRIDWRQIEENFDVLIEAPAGLGSVVLKRRPTVASVQRSGQPTVTGPSASPLLQQALGLQAAVPVEQMSLWIRGLPGDSSKAQYDDNGRLSSMEYRDSQGTLWRAKIHKHTFYDETQVPALISAVGGPYNVRLVLKKWSDYSSSVSDTDGKSSKKSGRLSIPGK